MLLMVIGNMIKGGARIDNTPGVNMAYTAAAAKAGYERAMKAHNWS